LASDYKPAAQTPTRTKKSGGLNGNDELQMPPGCLPHRGEIRYIIATVPHPTRTRLSLIFDRYVESILAGVNNAGYTFHSYWLPWTNAESPELKSLQDQKAHEEDVKSRERAPGILLFRAPWQDAKQAPRALAVLLVGETPTSGIDETAFHHAVDIVGPQRKVAVIGPSFSGSFWSLKQLLRQYPNRFSVVTGAATVEHERTDFQKWIASTGGDFTATLRDDGASAESLFEHVCSEWGSNVSLAVIAESGTTYGVRRRTEVNKKTACKNVTWLTFPREISRLRNAYGEHPELAPANGTPPPNPSSPQLPLDLRDPTPGSDGVPLMARAQTPLSQEGVLQRLVRALRINHARFALLRATDPFDAVFLARYLRTNCPDVHLLMETADVLFARAARESPLDGTLTITTYPPFGLRSRPGTEQATPLFASHAAHGVYNATVTAILKSSDAVLDARNPPHCVGFEQLFCTDGAQSRTPRDAGGAVPAAPPLWITTLTPNGYLPLAIVGLPKDARLCSPISPNPPYLILGAVLICVFATLLLRVWSPSAVGHYALLQWTALSVAAASVVVLLGPFVLNIRFAPGLKSILFGSATVVAGSAAVSVARQFKLEKTARNFYAYIPGGVLFAFAAAYLSIFRYQDHLENVFFAYRSLRPLNGASPALPILLLLVAAFWWAIGHLQRHTRFLRWRQHHLSPVLARLGIDTHAVGNLLGGIVPQDIIPRLHRNLDGSVAPSVGREQILTAVAVGALFLPVALGMSAFEPAPYNVLFAALFTFVATAGAMSVWRFCRLWGRMQKVLRQLDSHHASEIFSAIGSEHSWSALLAHADGQCGRRYAELARKIQASEGFAQRSPAFQHAIRSISRATPPQLRRIAPEALKSLQDEISEEVQRRGYSYVWSRREAAIKERLVTFRIDRRQELEFSTLELLALPAYEFILFLTRQMKNLLLLGAGIFFLAGSAVLSYPFLESGLIDKILLAGFLIAGIFITRVLAQADKDPILSAINGSEPGKLGVQFFRNIFVFGVAPLLTIVAAYFPQVGRFLTSFVSASSLAGQGL